MAIELLWELGFPRGDFRWKKISPRHFFPCSIPDPEVFVRNTLITGAVESCWTLFFPRKSRGIRAARRVNVKRSLLPFCRIAIILKRIEEALKERTRRRPSEIPRTREDAHASVLNPRTTPLFSKFSATQQHALALGLPFDETSNGMYGWYFFSVIQRDGVCAEGISRPAFSRQCCAERGRDRWGWSQPTNEPDDQTSLRITVVDRLWRSTAQRRSIT